MMNIPIQRNYSCKDEELPLLGGFTVSSMTRDLSDFTTYSPHFTQEFVKNFEAAIATANEVIQPKSELMKQKEITTRIFNTLTILFDSCNRLRGYLKLANGSLNSTPAKFGITLMKKQISRKDTEGVIQSLKLINDNIAMNKEVLMAQGLNDELIAVFVNAEKSLDDDKRKQVKMISDRKGIILNNISLFNGLYAELCNIMTVGKILYRTTNSAKLQDYTFSDLKKRVRRATNTAPVVNPVAPQA